MADLRISELAALAGGNLASGDLLPIVDVSASETKKITVVDLVGNATTLIADATIPGAKILFGSAQVPGSALIDSGVSTSKLANDAVTAAKLGDESSVDLVTTLPASGAFIGQLALDTDDLKIYCWDGSVWQSIKAAGSINTVTGSGAGIVNVSVTTSGDTVTISTTLDNTSAAGQFLGGPASAGGAVGYRTLTGTDLPTATTTSKGGVVVNGNGLAMSGDTITINNTVTAETNIHHVVQYNSKGLVTAGRAITGADLPLATGGSVGAIRPDADLTVSGAGVLTHTNAVTAGTATKVTFNAQGHITAGTNLVAADIPEIPASKITSGSLSTSLLANNSIAGTKLANASTVKFGGSGSTAGVVTFPTPEFQGQYFFDALNGDLYLYDGAAWQPITITAGELIYAGTYNAALNQVKSLTAAGTAAGLVVGSALPASSNNNLRYYLVVSDSGTGTAPAPAVALAPPDMIVSNGNAWELVDVSNGIAGQLASNISFTPYGGVAATNVQTAIQELEDDKLDKAGGTITGNLEIGSAGSLTFEGVTPNANETTLAVVDPTADRTITLPDASGTVVLSGAIVNADINASAAIVDTKLATISTAGKVSNTATTATSANTASAIVARDGSGNFSAGQISSTGELIGTTTALTNVYAIASALTPAVQIQGTTGNAAALSITRNTSAAANLILQRGVTGTPVADTDAVGQINFNGFDGTNYFNAALIRGVVDGTPGTGSMPGRLSFQTTPTGSTTPVERLRIDSAGQIQAAALGTAAAPIYSFTGDPNTGIYSPGADQLALSTNGTGKLFIDSSGVIEGYNTQSNGTGIVTGLRLNSARAVGNDGTEITFNLDFPGYSALAGIAGVFSGGGNNGHLTFKTVNSGTYAERLRITSAGLVGVGASSAPGGGDSRMWIDQAGTNDLGLLINASGGVKQPTLWFRDASATLSGKIVGQSGLTLATSSSATAAITIDSSQRVGIGTSSPDTNSRLHVSASENTSDPFATDASVAISNYQAAGNNEAASLKFLLGTAPGTNAGSISCHYDSFSAGVNSSLRFYTVYQSGFNSPAERMRIDPQGRVGIGSTSDPGGYNARLWIDNTADSTLTLNTTGSSSLSQIVFRNSNVNGEARLMNGTGGPLTFHRSFGNEAARIDTSGRLLVGTSTAVAAGAKLQTVDGITFPAAQVASTDPNTLDDYEEGTWTPTLTTSGTGFSSVTYNAVTSGKYTKVGRLVTFQGVLNTTAVTIGSASGFPMIGGLPFARASDDQFGMFAGMQRSGWSTNVPSTGALESGGTRIYLQYFTSANGATSYSAVSDVSTGTNQIYFGGFYMTA